MFEKTKALCDSFLKMGVPGFDLAIWKDGQCALRYMGGCADLENKIPVKGNERYNIYSCSKPITCAAAMQLWEKGLFSLEDKLCDYMPEFAEMTVRTGDGVKKAEKPILVRHLFEMTAGFTYNLGSPGLKLCREETGGRCPTREAMRYLARDPLAFEPGSFWQYSLCHDVLAALVEVISGEKFEDYTKKHIFDPLGMKDSTFLQPLDALDTIARQYRYNAEEKKVINPGKTVSYRIGTEYASGGAGCASTVEDYIRFLEAMRVGDQILGKDTIKLMATDRLNDQQRSTYWTAQTHGYGLGLRTPKPGSIFTDFGWGGAAGAFLAVDVENGLSIYHSQHLLSSPNQGIRGHVYQFAMAELVGNPDFKALIQQNVEAGEYHYTF